MCNNGCPQNCRMWRVQVPEECLCPLWNVAWHVRSFLLLLVLSAPAPSSPPNRTLQGAQNVSAKCCYTYLARNANCLSVGMLWLLPSMSQGKWLWAANGLDTIRFHWLALYYKNTIFVDSILAKQLTLARWWPFNNSKITLMSAAYPLKITMTTTAMIKNFGPKWYYYNIHWVSLKLTIFKQNFHFNMPPCTVSGTTSQHGITV